MSRWQLPQSPGHFLGPDVNSIVYCGQNVPPRSTMPLLREIVKTQDLTSFGIRHNWSLYPYQNGPWVNRDNTEPWQSWRLAGLAKLHFIKRGSSSWTHPMFWPSLVAVRNNPGNVPLRYFPSATWPTQRKDHTDFHSLEETVFITIFSCSVLDTWRGFTKLASKYLLMAINLTFSCINMNFDPFWWKLISEHLHRSAVKDRGRAVQKQ